MTVLTRMRTIEGCNKELQKLDPETALKPYAIRQLVLENKVKYVKSGRKYLVNFDSLLEYIAKSTEQDIKSNIFEAGKLRKVNG